MAPWPVTLVENGRPTSCLVLSSEAYNSVVDAKPKGRRPAAVDPIALERRAAEEIQEHLRRISGSTVEIVAAGDDEPAAAGAVEERDIHGGKR